ncbi:MAG: Triacylglycerol lipase [Pseudomonadales bacterium]|nr:Triacylglycerol lipase [Pseudomonadales bacterium]MEC8813933.1 alpha/beta fold hydrolase [Pseudomonadota bacterium]HAG94285.1 Triacylglycerol lipase [Gammaproteobacteria bacterium]HAU13430.1 Triacylglycerol lipase [Gammaproteobacteria bacterium]HBO95771.1 Triacylglycerol lipase [Gammaproteobacteria bacterium]|tara:strand:- start:2070 stop:3872 length:1803 start_codon:yes stop_codon:yes gene_type:complete
MKNTWLIQGLCAAGLTSLLTLPLTPLTAAPVLGPEGMDFYSPPTITAGNHGDLIWYREANIDLGKDAPFTRSWDVAYWSVDSNGRPNVVTGSVILPTARWSGTGSRPVLSYAVGTHGLGQRCAPSLQLAAGTDYEQANIAAAINRGYAVLITDNAGYTNGDTPTYLAGESQAHAAVDIVTAATQIPEAGIVDDQVAIWGYSQGGQTGAWIAEIQQDYVPDMNIVGIAAGGTPADVPYTSFNLDGDAGSAFLLGAIIGYEAEYGSAMPLYELANNYGLQQIEVGKSQCVFESLFNFMGDELAQYTLDNRPLSDLITIASVNEVLTDQNLGNVKPSVPMYMYHGQADEFIPLDQHIDLKDKYCAMGSNIRFQVFPSEHIATQFQAAPYALDWIDDRFAGKPAFSACYTGQPEPESTANPYDGALIFTLDNWKLDADIRLGTLRQNVILPEESTFYADSDVTNRSLIGTLNVPQFFTRLNIILPLDVNLTIDPTLPTSGYVELDTSGDLHIDGNAYTTVKVNSAGVGWIQIPFGCRTKEPAEFPITFDGPISDLGGGNITFSGTTTFSSMTGCGLFNGLFTVLMSGPGQQYRFNVSPPEPFTY